MPTGAMTVEGRFEIARTPRAIFDVLADPSTWSTFDPALVEVEAHQPMAAGVTGTMRRRAGLGLTVKTTWEVTAFVPDTRLENLITGFGYELRETILLASDASGTTMTVVDTLVPTSLVGRVMAAMSRGIIERDLESRYRRLKTWLESGSARED